MASIAATPIFPKKIAPADSLPHLQMHQAKVRNLGLLQPQLLKAGHLSQMWQARVGYVNLSKSQYVEFFQFRNLPQAGIRQIATAI